MFLLLYLRYSYKNSPKSSLLWHNCARLESRFSANVAELVDALDLGSSGVTRGSSTLPIRTRLRSQGMGFGMRASCRYDGPESHEI